MRRWMLAGLLGLAAAAGCKRPEPPQPEREYTEDSGRPSAPSGPVTVTAEARAEARTIFTTRCGPCHGATGAGDGAAAAALNPRPRNFHEASWQSSVTDDQIERVIRGGGPAIGKSPIMPPNPDLNDRPVVVAALREHIRGLR